MFNSSQEMIDWACSNTRNANQFNKAVESGFRRRLVLIIDDSDKTIITGFAASKNKKRLKR